MNDLTISQAYFLCAVQPKGKIFSYHARKIACLLTAVLAELKTVGSIDISGQQLTLIQTPPEQFPHLSVVYEQFRELEILDLPHLLREYQNALSDRHLNALSVSLGESLAEKGLVTSAKLGLFNGRRYYVPRSNALPSVMAEYAVDVLYRTPVSFEDSLLWILMKNSYCIPSGLPEEQQELIDQKIFSESNTEKKRLQEFSGYLERFLSSVKWTSPLQD